MVHVIVTGSDASAMAGVCAAFSDDPAFTLQREQFPEDAPRPPVAIPAPELLVVCVASVDIRLVDALARFRTREPRAPVLILAGADGGLVPALAALGACLLVTGGIRLQDLVGVARLLTAGYAIVRRDQMTPGRAGDGRADRHARMTHALTRREREVCELLAQGMTNRQIAEALSVSRSTVKTHVEGVLAKFGARSRVEIMLTLHR
ncbi:response regulator transcription factor [Streptosporangiaceae bacterium NEAU-GS5]|nr:response regulator transcription factor [Streptosporangiaceae bacterium NEAU-GS5]